MKASDDKDEIAAARRRGDAAQAGLLGRTEVARAMLDDPNPRVRASALSALVRAGATTTDDAKRALHDADAAVRRRACELAPGLVGANYQELLADSDPSVVEVACFALGECQDASGVAALERIAKAHADPLCRESAIAALGAIGEHGSLATIIAALGDVATIRRRAVVALAGFDEESTRNALTSCLNDRDWQVRQAAEDILGRFAN